MSIGTTAARTEAYWREQIEGERNARPEQKAALRLIYERTVGRPYVP